MESSGKGSTEMKEWHKRIRKTNVQEQYRGRKGKFREQLRQNVSDILSSNWEEKLTLAAAETNDNFALSVNEACMNEYIMTQISAGQKLVQQQGRMETFLITKRTSKKKVLTFLFV